MKKLLRNLLRITFMLIVAGITMSAMILPFSGELWAIIGAFAWIIIVYTAMATYGKQITDFITND